MTEEYIEKHRLEMEHDLGIEVEPYTEEELIWLEEHSRNIGYDSNFGE